ncbi:MAG: D-alanine--D-alanine ligase family protein [Anaerolineales bacterium]|jgi:D-alanine-D-alanine ligase
MTVSEKIQLGIIFGGRSGEHEVSLMSARSVLDALDPEKYSVTQVGITHQGCWVVGENVLDVMETGETRQLNLATMLPDPTRNDLFEMNVNQDGISLSELSKFDVVFPVLHGTFGEDGTLQGLLELAEVPYIGAGVLGSSLGMDKGVFKDVMRANNIPVLDSMVVTRRQIETDHSSILEAAARLADFPVFVKPANLGSSVGITKCWSKSDLYEGLLEAASYDRRVVIEKGIEAREIEISVLGNEQPAASVPGEVIPSREFYSYEAKYIDNASELIIPAPLPQHVKTLITELAIKAYKAIDCAGMARVDFLIDKNIDQSRMENGVYLNELNTIPGFTKISMYPKLWEASELPYSELLDRLVELALERKSERDGITREYRGEK